MPCKREVHTRIGKAFRNLHPIIDRESGKQIVFVFKVLHEIEVRDTDGRKALRFGVGDLIKRPLHQCIGIRAARFSNV